MPIYEFHCEKCEQDSEILVRSTDWKNSECPHCGSKKLAKKFSTFASTGPAGSAPSGGNGGDIAVAAIVTSIDFLIPFALKRLRASMLSFRSGRQR